MTPVASRVYLYGQSPVWNVIKQRQNEALKKNGVSLKPSLQLGLVWHEVKLNDLIRAQLPARTRADPSLLSRTGNDVNVANNRGDTEEDLGLTTRWWRSTSAEKLPQLTPRTSCSCPPPWQSACWRLLQTLLTKPRRTVPQWTLIICCCFYLFIFKQSLNRVLIPVSVLFRYLCKKKSSLL